MAPLATASSIDIHPDARRGGGTKLAIDVTNAEFKPHTHRSAVADKVLLAAAAAAPTTAAPAHPSNNAGDGGVRVLKLDEYRAAAASLAEAFRDDHTTVYFTDTPDRAHWTPAQKWELHVKMMEYVTYAHLLKGLVVAAGENYDCVALWMPPGENMDDYLTIVRSGMWRLSYQLSPEGRKRFFDEFLPLLNTTKAQVLGARDQDSWYLVYIGTRPAGRGRGHARRVIDYVTALADAAGRPCYLESSAEVNQRIYGRMGFVLRKCIYLQREVEHVQLDIMVREPRAVAAPVGKQRDADADSGVDVQ